MHTATCSAKQRNLSTANCNAKAWIDQEIKGAYFKDARLGKRLRTLLELMSNGIGNSIPFRNGATPRRLTGSSPIPESAKRKFSVAILPPQARANAVNKTLMVFYDTTEFCYQTESKSIGLLTDLPFPSKRRCKFRGLLMYSSLATRRRYSLSVHSSLEQDVLFLSQLFGFNKINL